MASKCAPTRDDILHKLQDISESDLTKRFLIPLFKSFGYDSVEYYGGQFEGGKDLICWRKDELNTTELAVVQVKKFKFSAAASNKRSFGEVITQLQQASEKSVPNIDGQEYYPSLIYLITPYLIDTRALESRFEGYSSLRRSRVKIVDGPLLLNLLKIRQPSLFKELANVNILIQENLLNTLNNTDLLKALDSRFEKDISQFYCDLDIGLGNVNTRLFSSLKFKGTNKNWEISADEWERFYPICEHVENYFQIEIINPSYKEITLAYENKKKEFEKFLKEGIPEIPNGINEALAALDRIELEIENNLASIQYISVEPEVELASYYRLIMNELNCLKSSSNSEILNKSHHKIEDIVNRIKNIEPQVFKKYNTPQSIYSYLKNLNKLRKFEEKRSKLFESEEPHFCFSVNGKELCLILLEKQKWLRKETNKFKKGSASIIDIKAYLVKCKDIIDNSELFLNDPIFKEILGLSGNKSYLDGTNSPRHNISIDDVFKTGLNIIVLGEAGAGKTTTLQMYAKRNLGNVNEDRQFLYLPLARVISTLTKDEAEISSSRKLIEAIVTYLTKQGISVINEEFFRIVNEKGLVFLLDGIDEVIGQVSWLPEAIIEMSTNYPKAQIICSSRISGKYLKKINFCGILLLPFTDYQREYFIKNWFSNENNETVSNIIKHIESCSEIGNIVRNPLLATILCVLAEHNIPLPESEIQLYEERMKLLMGKYDIFKRVSRLKSYQRHLELVSQKIACRLHSKRKRSDYIENLRDNAVFALKGKISKNAVSTAIEELIDPCNILVPMTENGQYGFGHLQFQEYLTACELCSNRGIEIGPLMYDPWWRGALVFFARMTDEIEFIISWLAVEGNFTSAYGTLNAILSVRPTHERTGLKEIISKHFEMDAFDEGFDIDDIENIGFNVREREIFDVI